MKINQLLTPYNYNSGTISRVKYIVIHYVGATGGAKANCQYYANAYRGASAHYFVGFDGEIWQAVEDKNIAWHCGAKSYKHPECRNANSIGIELCVRNKGSQADTSRDWYFEDATVESAIQLTKELMAKYAVPADHVIRHYDVTGKICPNPYVYNTGKHTWEKFKAALTAQETEKKSGWYQEDGQWRFYLGDTGQPVKNNWYKDDTGHWSWFNGAGDAIHDTWYQYENAWYWFNSNCYMAESQWITYKGNDYYLDADGIMATNAYIKSKDPSSNLYYFVGDDGIWVKDKTTERPESEYPIVS